MQIKVELFFYQKVLEEIAPLILLFGSESLENSRKIEKYKVSLRELIGLCILCSFRDFLEPSRWLFSTNQELSDDGAVARIEDKNGNQASYYERVEQIYLPGKFLKRNANESINDYVLKQIETAKGKKGIDYRKDVSLFIFSDIRSDNNSDCFEWQDFVQKFFNKETFLHLYFVSLRKHTFSYNEYYMLSFTNQKHRQKLNGEFTFRLKPGEIFSFKCLQRINLLKSK